ncbi:MAG: PEP-CTERM sorting domain-containing protein, partial [Verrucomicrobiales bacterium]|nr:PEP-CTERM sorting domain-containing protein [Verrucomicrobiales bacterium]
FDNTSNPNVFVQFDQATHWNTNRWDHGFNGGVNATNDPWTEITQTGGHPNTSNTNLISNPGVNPKGPEFWAVRRYTVPAGISGQIGADWHVFKNNTNGTGVTGALLHNGTIIDSAAIAGNANTRSSGGSGLTTFPVTPGDTVEFALTPEGAGGAAGDGSDSSTFGMNLGFVTTVQNAALIADSIADWSTNGTQGENGWTYGYYDVTASPNHATGDLIEFDPGTHWTGSAWDLGGGAPWTNVGESAAHPNGINNAAEHWVTRRYEVGAGETGDLYVDFSFNATNLNGTGVSLNILHNGTLVSTTTIAGNDGDGVTRTAFIPGAQLGDSIDISLTPVGLNGDPADGSDGSAFSAKIYLAPEPGTMALLSLTGLALIFRRRR